TPADASLRKALDRDHGGTTAQVGEPALQPPTAGAGEEPELALVAQTARLKFLKCPVGAEIARPVGLVHCPLPHQGRRGEGDNCLPPLFCTSREPGPTGAHAPARLNG